MRSCSKCGVAKPVSEFYLTSKGRPAACCKPCYKARVKKHVDANYEQVRESNNKAVAKFYLANRERELKRTKAYNEANKDRLKPYYASYLQQNLAQHAAHQGKRRAKKLLATPRWATQSYVDLFYALAKEEEARIGMEVHVDHIVPLIHPRVCGLHTEHNLQLLTGLANRSKSNSFWPDM